MLEGPFDFEREIDEKLASINLPPIFLKECSRPLFDMRFLIERLAFDELDQIRHLLRAVIERKGPSAFLCLEVPNVYVRLLKTNGAGEPKLLGTAGEARDVQVVVERVLHPSNVCRRRGNHQLSIDQTLIIALSRAQHHEVLTEGNRSPVMICSDMLDSELGHLNPRSTSIEASTVS
jgi:hypothetical protein